MEENKWRLMWEELEKGIREAIPTVNPNVYTEGHYNFYAEGQKSMQDRYEYLIESIKKKYFPPEVPLEDQAAFELVNMDTGHKYTIYLSGRIDGFNEKLVVKNYFHSRLMREIGELRQYEKMWEELKDTAGLWHPKSWNNLKELMVKMQNDYFRGL